MNVYVLMWSFCKGVAQLLQGAPVFCQNSGQRQAHHLRNLAMFHPADRVQNNDLTVFLGKEVQHFGQDEPVLGIAKRIEGARSGRVEIAVLIRRRPGGAALLAELHETDVARDRDDPGDGPAHGPIEVRGAPDLQIGILHGVLGVAAVPQDGERVAQNQILGERIEAHESIPVAIRNLREQGFIDHDLALGRCFCISDG